MIKFASEAFTKAISMSASIYSDYPPKLTSEQEAFLLSNLKDWSILNGLAVRPSTSFIPEDVDPSRSTAVTAPVTLFPSCFPRTCFEEARAIQEAYNELYAVIASHEGWLQQIVEEYAVPSSSRVLKQYHVHFSRCILHL